LSAVLEKLDKKAERADEREMKRIQLEAELQESRCEKEREHEMHIQGVVLSFLQHMTSLFSNSPSIGTASMPPSYSITYFYPTDFPLHHKTHMTLMIFKIVLIYIMLSNELQILLVCLSDPY